MEEEKSRQIIGKRNFNGYRDQIGFDQTEDGVREILQAEIMSMYRQLIKTAILEADADNEKTLNHKRAAQAIERMPLIPSGHYQ